VFGEKVGWIQLAIDLPHLDPAGPHGLLYPQGVGIQVTQFAKPLARADANCGRAVRPHSDWWIET